MTEIIPPVFALEPERLLDLSKLDLDYSALAHEFEDLTKLAAQIAGAPVSLINLIDSFTQWSIANYGMPVVSTPREESVCQYTIASDSDRFEVKNLAEDDRFKDKSYITAPGGFRYYMGVPLKGENGANIGALCVLDKEVRELSPERTEFLKIIANSISKRLQWLKRINDISNRLTSAEEDRKTLARNIREPLAGIVGILQVILEKGIDMSTEEFMELATLIQKSAITMLSITDGVLNSEEERKINADQGNLTWLKNSIETLYAPQCREKHINLEINTSSRTETIPFSKKNLLQILGNLISYAVKHSADGSSLTIELILKVNVLQNLLVMMLRYADTSPDAGRISQLIDGNSGQKKITGETDGQALHLVNGLVADLNGTVDIDFVNRENTVITINIPQGN